MSACATIVWFRQDLRLADNPALRAAADRGGPIVPVFIWAPEEEGDWSPGAASRWWLHQSLKQLAADLKRRGSRLILRAGPSLATLRALLRNCNADAVFWSRRYEPAAIARDADVKKQLCALGIVAESFNAALLFEPWKITTRDGRPCRVFTAFWKACLASESPAEPRPAPVRLAPPEAWPATVELDAFKLEPAIDWAKGLRATWRPGEAGAQATLDAFLENALRRYHDNRDHPGIVGTSRLSPHLHFGEISPLQIRDAVLKTMHTPSDDVHVDKFVSELGWREFAHHLLYHFPDTATRPLRSEFDRFPWRESSADVRAWQRGLTGYPLVDAGMRELWQTGWLHNRVRMVVASFLSKHLLIPWQIGARWFWDTLVDADLANNTLGWQWTAGCGADAAPYFRIFNPVSQGQKFDSQGEYVRAYVRELKRLPADNIQFPSAAPSALLARAGVELGQTYPLPIVEHSVARQRALAAFATIRRSIAI